MTDSDKNFLLKDALSHLSSAKGDLATILGEEKFADHATLSSIERELREAADLVRRSYRTDEIGEVETEAGEDI